MTMNQTAARAQRSALAFALIGALFVAAAIFASLSARNWVVAGLAGAAGLALWRRGLLGDWPATPIAFDAAAFAIFAFQRNDFLAFWQLAGPWADVPRFNVAGASIAYAVYIGGALAALIGAHRALRPIEAIGLVAIPFLFNLVITLGADWHMAELGALATGGLVASFQGQVFVGRVLVLFCASEIGLEILSLMGLGRLVRTPKLHRLVLGDRGVRRADAASGQFRPERPRARGGDRVQRAVRRARAGRSVGAGPFRHRPRARRAHGEAAEFRLGPRPLAPRLREGRDLRRHVHARRARRRGAAARSRLCGLRQELRPSRGAGRRRARLSLRANPHRQRRRHAAVLRAPVRGLSRPARHGARRRRRLRRRLGLCGRPRSRESEPALLLDVRRRRLRLRGHRYPLRCGARRRRASGARSRPGASMRSASRSAALSRAPSAGISTRRSSPSS